jgi:hypothetical protein
MGEGAFIETPTVLKTGCKLLCICNKLLDLDAEEKVVAEGEADKESNKVEIKTAKLISATNDWIEKNSSFLVSKGADNLSENLPTALSCYVRRLKLRNCADLPDAEIEQEEFSDAVKG